MNSQPDKRVEIVCPCCRARLHVDTELGKVIGHEAPEKRSAPDLDRAPVLLQKRAAEREARFRQSTEDERIKSRLLERKFEERLARAKDEPATPPTRDIDLE